MSSLCLQDSYDMFEMNGEVDVKMKKKKKIKKKDRLEGMKKEMDIVSVVHKTRRRERWREYAKLNEMGQNCSINSL